MLCRPSHPECLLHTARQLARSPPFSSATGNASRSRLSLSRTGNGRARKLFSRSQSLLPFVDRRHATDFGEADTPTLAESKVNTELKSRMGWAVDGSMFFARFSVPHPLHSFHILKHFASVCIWSCTPKALHSFTAGNLLTPDQS